MFNTIVIENDIRRAIICYDPFYKKYFVLYYINEMPCTVSGNVVERNAKYFNTLKGAKISARRFTAL